MIVDDQREIRSLLRAALVTLDQNLEIVEMPSGEEAYLDASRYKVDLLVADFRLPGISGLQLMIKIRALYPEAKVFLITGLVDPGVRKQVADAGADAFFIKPISMADFLDSVERVLGLIETILPLEPVLADDTPDERKSLAELLAGLRAGTHARAVMLINDRGRVLACAGDLPDKSHEISLVASLMAIYSAGKNVSQLIDQPVHSAWHAFTGGRYDMLFVPVDVTHAILVVGSGVAAGNGLLENLQQYSACRQAIEESLSVLEGPAIPHIQVVPVERKTEPEPEPGGQDLEPMLKENKRKVKTGELDAFWREADNGEPVSPMHADGLSYEQARQLGFTPGEGRA